LNLRCHLTPCAQKGPKKTLRFFFIAFELGIVFFSPCQGVQNTKLSSKAKKKYQMFFFGPFWAQGVTCTGIKMGGWCLGAAANAAAMQVPPFPPSLPSWRLARGSQAPAPRF
jgi:hypothetical protein